MHFFCYSQIPNIVYKWYDYEFAPVHISVVGVDKVDGKMQAKVKDLKVACLGSLFSWDWLTFPPTRRYKMIRPYSEGMAAVANKYSDLVSYYNWGFIDEKGKLVIPCKYYRARPFHEGLAAVYKPLFKKNPNGANGWVYIDKKGNEVISKTYDAASDFIDGKAIVIDEISKNDILVYAINKKGDILDRKRMKNRRHAFFIPIPHNEWTNDGDSILKIDDEGKIQLVKNYEPKHIAGAFSTEISHQKIYLNQFGRINYDCEPRNIFGSAGIDGIYYIKDMECYGNKAELLRWSKNDSHLMLTLAAKYYLGDSRFLINQSFKKAFMYYKLAAEKFKVSEAQKMVGWMYEHGQGVEKNDYLAKCWYERSEIDGDEMRIALVIGNQDYPNYKSLRCPEKDANDMILKLSGLGFKIIPAINKAKPELKDSINSFLERAKVAEVALVYYSGHGMQYKEKNYLLPKNYDDNEFVTVMADDDVDSNIDTTERWLTDNCITAQDILKQLDDTKCATKILIWDACRDFNGYKGSEDNVFVPTNSDTYIMYATTEGDKARDGKTGDNSLFTSRLLKALDIPDLTIYEIFNIVKWKKKPHPVMYPQKQAGKEDFIFNTKKK